jgi:hypothetical protein
LIRTRTVFRRAKRCRHACATPRAAATAGGKCCYHGRTRSQPAVIDSRRYISGTTASARRRWFGGQLIFGTIRYPRDIHVVSTPYLRGIYAVATRSPHGIHSVTTRYPFGLHTIRPSSQFITLRRWLLRLAGAKPLTYRGPLAFSRFPGWTGRCQRHFRGAPHPAAQGGLLLHMRQLLGIAPGSAFS